jgi:hypothetical protein
MAAAAGEAQPALHARYPDTLFRAPLNNTLTMSGSFGELRGGHFHSGLDFTTGERPGQPVKAIAQGSIVRIKVSASGFGKALYIRHPSGYTSVYAHLSTFQKPIAEYVKKAQYRQESYQLNLYPGEDQFQVRQGEVIGQSGNSGSSTGPHLHFEIRETRTEKPINPLFFGFQVKDTRAPVIRGVRLYPKGPESQLRVDFQNGRQPVTSYHEPVTLKVQRAQDGYRLTNVKTLKARGRLGVSVAVTDYHDRSSHALGVNRITLRQDSTVIFQSIIDKFRFAQTRYVNAHLDYAAYKSTNTEYQCCFVLPGNQLPFYQTKRRGLVLVKNDQRTSINLTASDSYGNKAELSCTIGYLSARDTAGRPEPEAGLKALPHDAESSVQTPGLSLYFPAGAFYDTVAFTLKHEERPDDAYAPFYQIHNQYTPVHRSYKLVMDAQGVPPFLRDKALVVQQAAGGKLKAVGGTYKDGAVHARSRSFGRFTLDVDTIAPEAQLVNVPQGRSYTAGRPLRVRITDNLAGIADYTPTIDGKWVRMAYNKKRDVLIFRDFERLSAGKHTFKLDMTDEQGNQQTFRKTIQIP